MDMVRTQNSELRNLFDIIHVFKCTAYNEVMYIIISVYTDIAYNNNN